MEATRAFLWNVRTDTGVLEIALERAGTAAEATRGMEGQVHATPYRFSIPGCTTCSLCKRPGLSEGYCPVRTDLAPAYGEHHPLRQLPQDRGESCEHWRGWYQC